MGENIIKYGLISWREITRMLVVGQTFPAGRKLAGKEGREGGTAY